MSNVDDLQLIVELAERGASCPNQCTAGLQSVDVCDAAKQAAQRIANARGESVWLCWESSDDENDVADAYSGNGLEFRPR